MYSRHGGRDFAKFSPLQNIERRARSIRLIDTLDEWGLDFSLYHPPIVQEYYSRSEYVGSIVLLRSLEYFPISKATLVTLGRLTPFLSYMLSNCIVRSRFESPETRVVNTIIDQIQETPKYSDQDTSILTLLLYGYSYKEAAASLDISIDTVKKHVKKIYSHERVGSLSELWAKYITFQESSEIKQQKTPERANVTRGKGTQRGTVPEPTGSVHLHQ
jgi:DNA-binding CsgD family transcriptional regulator